MKQLWNGVSAPPEGGKGTGDSAAAALSGGHSFVSVLRERWQLAVVILGFKNRNTRPLILKPYSLILSRSIIFSWLVAKLL